jgi:DNA-binding MarR family transcriptional regulator
MLRLSTSVYEWSSGYRPGVTSQRYDLGATFHRLSQALIAAEEPVLAGMGVEMWDYIVLVALRDRPARSQAALAARAGRDTTRLIPILDRLEQRDLLRRTPDPADRRIRVVELTDAGTRLVTDCQDAIRAMERDLLADLPDAERAAFIATLERTADLVLGPRAPG